MTTTVLIGDDAHILLIKKRTEFKEKKIPITMSELVEKIIISGINNIKAE